MPSPQQGAQQAEELTGINLVSILQSQQGEFKAEVGGIKLFARAKPGHSLEALVPMWTVTRISPATTQQSQVQYEESQSQQGRQYQDIAGR